MQFDFLKKQAESGQSFIAVGRCSEYVLREYKGLVKLFILADAEVKTQRIMKLHNMSHDAAADWIKKTDKQRKTYHNFYCPNKWGDSRYYDICMNSSKLGIEETVNFLANYIKLRIK